MPTSKFVCTYISWNIKDFGKGGDGSKDIEFIANTIFAYAADVISILEPYVSDGNSVTQNVVDLFSSLLGILQTSDSKAGWEGEISKANAAANESTKDAYIIFYRTKPSLSNFPYSPLPAGTEIPVNLSISNFGIQAQGFSGKKRKSGTENVKNYTFGNSRKPVGFNVGLDNGSGNNASCYFMGFHNYWVKYNETTGKKDDLEQATKTRKKCVEECLNVAGLQSNNNGSSNNGFVIGLDSNLSYTTNQVWYNNLSFRGYNSSNTKIDFPIQVGLQNEGTSLSTKVVKNSYTSNAYDNFLSSNVKIQSSQVIDSVEDLVEDGDYGQVRASLNYYRQHISDHLGIVTTIIISET